jgi:hypothetical protein
MTCCARIYGVMFSLFVPVRAVYANALNSVATVRALRDYAVARALGRPLKWLKTEHAYPTRGTLLAHRRRLGDILTASGYLTPGALAAALASLPPSVRLGEHLVNTGALSSEALYEALSVQQGLPVAQIEPGAVPDGVARALPEKLIRDWKVLPFRVDTGALYLAGPEFPTSETTRALRSFTSLDLRFHLISPAKFEALVVALL